MAQAGANRLHLILCRVRCGKQRSELSSPLNKKERSGFFEFIGRPSLKSYYALLPGPTLKAMFPRTTFASKPLVAGQTSKWSTQATRRNSVWHVATLNFFGPSQQSLSGKNDDARYWSSQNLFPQSLFLSRCTSTPARRSQGRKPGTPESLRFA